MDWQQAAVSVGGIVATVVITQIRNDAKHGQRMETAEALLKDHALLHVEHQKQFAGLPDKYVTRLELTEKLKQISDSQNTVQRWLEYLLFNRKPMPPIPSRNPEMPSSD